MCLHCMANTVGLQCIFAATVPKYCTKAPQNVAANSRGMPREILRENSEGNKTVPLSICGYLKILFTDSSSIRSHYIPFNDIIIFANLGFSGCYEKKQVVHENQRKKWGWQCPIWFQGLRSCAVSSRLIHSSSQ